MIKNVNGGGGREGGKSTSKKKEKKNMYLIDLLIRSLFDFEERDFV